MRAGRRSAGIRRLVLLLAVAVGGFLFLHSPFFRVKNVAVQGTSRLAPAQVQALLGLDPGEYLWQLDSGALSRRLLQYPMIAEASVRRVWPQTLRVTVREREALALVPYYRYYLALDPQAVAIEMVDDLNALRLPLITGPSAPRVTLGEVYPSASVNPPLQVLAGLGPDRRAQIDELHVEQSGELTIYLSGGVRVFWGSAERLSEKVALLQTILLDAEKKKLSLLYIDLRYRGQPVVKLRE